MIPIKRIKCVRIVLSFLMFMGLFLVQNEIFAQPTPTVTVRFAHPHNSCVTLEYCVDVEFRSDIPDQELFGMNIRFFYDDDVLELIDFRDFQGGYSAVSPDPPVIATSPAAGPALFNFLGPAEFVNGAMQLTSIGSPPIILDTVEWTKIFKMCFEVQGSSQNLDTFCPSLIWDLEQDPSNGGFLSGDDGIVLTIVDPDPNNESYPAIENVVQFNWQYSGNGTPPYGEPVDSICSNINCTLPLTFLSFKGAVKENGNLLEWTTLQEINVDGFFIQRNNFPAHQWTDIGFIKGNGNTDEVQQYHFLDSWPAQGNNLYRLREVDDDGRFSFSPIVRLYTHPNQLANHLRIAPNPVRNGSINVLWDGVLDSPHSLSLFDATGRLLEQKEITQPKTLLDVSIFPPGVYLVQLNTGSESLVQRVIIH